MSPEEERVMAAVRKIGMPALSQWKYRRDTPLGEFARAVLALREAEGVSYDVPKGRLVPR